MTSWILVTQPQCAHANIRAKSVSVFQGRHLLPACYLCPENSLCRYIFCHVLPDQCSLFCCVIVTLAMASGHSTSSSNTCFKLAFATSNSFSDREETIAAYAVARSTCTVLFSRICKVIFMRPTHIDCNHFMINYWWNLIWRSIRDPPNFQIKFLTKLSGYTVQ